MALRLLAQRTFRPTAVRAFCAGPDNAIPTDAEQQQGRRGFEVQGGTFNRDPVSDNPPADAQPSPRD